MKYNRRIVLFGHEIDLTLRRRGPSPQQPTDWNATHRHRKGGLYRHRTDGVLEADMSDVVIYDDAEGRVWVRPKSEFDDGRFTLIKHGQ